ncbi:aldehyde dehydrogenase family protein [Rhodococcus sp. WS1]|uniref:aldehyde dehydrogenase family protein n=1 Tax=unclassified Rhodococcus (in: high G+C Gram-positive bacteria) TaxID=192944 RepID=UPI00114356B0|nr:MULTISPECIES: aldehyde dehydrogenase family protein [unclassified Rhodococcus (in: high G+C Gram-positive bacteria)]ROZ52960.1 aldehyde dehydrogenase family protein [Rhodococcus sp. WS1]TQC36053.1 aldehyde dehydrogenase family protein [Rhodococcus sp. WS7]
MLLETIELPTGEHYARNLIDGRWEFPAAPYEYEIRNPSDSTITAVVPLSSRFDVDRAISAARQALSGPWSELHTREKLLALLLHRLAEAAPDLARLQSTETGLSYADSLATIESTLRIARVILTREVLHPRPGPACISGHVLSWGAPFSEMLLNVFPALAAGHTVVVKPSLRGPLSPAAVAFIADQLRFPAGVVNIVQGTGVDVGAALISSTALQTLHVRANESTLSRASRAEERTHVPLRTVSGGGNAAIVYPGLEEHKFATMATEIAEAVRVHNAGGPFGLHTVAVHRDVAKNAIACILGQLALFNNRAAPLPTEPLRRRALDRVDQLAAGGGRVLLGGTIPDDIQHRMGWRLPTTVVDLGEVTSKVTALAHSREPLGPVLTFVHWNTLADLDGVFDSRRHRDGYAAVWGDDSADDRTRFGVTAREQGPRSAMHSGLVPAAWTGESAHRGNEVTP